MLFDTHALLWWLTDDPKLSHRAREVTADEANPILVSAASAWKIATKFRLGKFDLAADAVSRFAELIAADGFEHLPVTYLHALKAAGYELDYRDLFGRMLAAQSALESASLITCNAAFEAFGAEVLW